MFHVKLNARSIVERLSAAQSLRLQRYAVLLRDRALPLGLVSESDADRLWERHVLDSLRGLACMEPADRTVVDVGSGAGLPGIPLAIALPSVEFVLAESKRPRVAFLEAAVEALGLRNVSVAPRRVEGLRIAPDMCLARALAPPAASWRLTSPLLSGKGRLLYWAGQTWGHHHVDQLATLGARAEICLQPEFQWQGPLVIITRFSPTPSRTDERA